MEVSSINNALVWSRQAEPGEETTSSQGEWEDYNDTLTEVLTWLEKAEKQLKGQAKISNDVDVVKDQFHEHEVWNEIIKIF